MHITWITKYFQTRIAYWFTCSQLFQSLFICTWWSVDDIKGHIHCFFLEYITQACIHPHVSSLFQQVFVHPFYNTILLRGVWCNEVSCNTLCLIKIFKRFGLVFPSMVRLQISDLSSCLSFYFGLLLLKLCKSLILMSHKISSNFLREIINEGDEVDCTCMWFNQRRTPHICMNIVQNVFRTMRSSLNM